MPTPATSNLPIPKDWNEFEEICADLFSKEWGDRNAMRNGRQGQRQNGVDIYGSPSTGGSAGVQCKGKRAWPPKQLTTAEIDVEVGEAKKFEPALTEFTIATAAPDDAALQKHVRKISLRHKQQGLFSVHIVGWGELTRRLTQHDLLVEKHYNFVGIASVKEDVTKVLQQTEKIASQLQNLMPVDEAIGRGVADALERDLVFRYRKALQRLLFPELHKIDEFAPLANEILADSRSAVSANFRRRVLLRAARRAAVLGRIAEAERFLAVAGQCPGDDSTLPAEARILEAQGRADEAIGKLRDEATPEARSVLLSILGRARGLDVALAWVAETKVAIDDLTPGGIHTLAVIHLERDIVSARNMLAAVPEALLAESPYLLFLRPAVRLAALFPKPDRPLALLGYPIDVRTAHPIGTPSFIESELDDALADLHRVLPMLRDLGLIQAQRVADLLLNWCELVHPVKKDKAIERLRMLMQRPAAALPNLQFALAYDPGFDPSPIRTYLDNREKLVGWNDDDLRAALILRTHGSDAQEVALFLAKHKKCLQQLLGIEAATAIEVQALAQIRDATSAQLVLDEHRNAISAEMARVLEAEVARAAGEDPVVALRQAYEETNNVDALRNLVAELIRRNDHKALAHFAEKLHAETDDPRDLVLTVNSLARARDDAGFLRIVEANPSLPDGNLPIARHYAWRLFERGRMTEAVALAQRLQRANGGSHRDLQLEIAIAIETGDWETLATPLNDLLATAEQRDGLTLIRAAHIAQVSGQGTFLGLLNAAVARAPDDPYVLLGAYTIVLEEGLEEKKPDAQQWFRRALDLSGPDGPVKTFELKELLAEQRNWTEHTSRLDDAIVQGMLPLTIAAQGFRTVLVDLLLRNLVGGSKQIDARKRTALPLFSGRRGPVRLGDVKTIAMDPSAAIVLAWLGILPRVLRTYPKIVLPASTLGELFEGFSRIRKFQKSQITLAQEVLAAIGSSRLKVQRSSAAMHDPLAQEVGASFVSLLRCAEQVDGYVVRPAPLKRVKHYDDVDVSAFKHRLVDVHCILHSLAEEGNIDEMAEDTARRYLAVQDKRWSNRPTLTNATPLFLDDLALHYLQTVNLLDPALRFYDNISIDQSTEAYFRALTESAADSTGIVAVIHEMRTAIHEAWSDGKLEFGPQSRRSEAEDEDDGDAAGGADLSTVHLFADLMESDIVLMDDRAFNKEAFVTDRSGHRAHIATTLDILEDLRARKSLSDAELRSLRYKLRSSGAVLVPVTAEEIVSAALRSRSKESAELRAVRESISLARRARIPKFPGEIPWLAQTILAIKQAIQRVWEEEPDKARAERLASAILELRPKPAEWLEQWEGAPPPQWVEQTEALIAAALALPVQISDEATLNAYHKWLERNLLEPIREISPETYQKVVEKVRELVLEESAEGDEDD